MNSTYAKFIAESAYKHTVDKPHTGNGIAFYEEPGRIAHRVDLDAIWTDAEYIPLDAPAVDKNGFYTVEVGSLNLRILQRLEDIPLDKVPGTKATYKSVYLIDTIFPSYGTGYSITLTDWNGEVIPFGLNQWVIDPDNGEITFLAGWPKEYQENPRISFYRYVGRKANTTFLRADGSVSMIPGYVPTKDLDIATKEYVDKATGDVNNIVSKLVPTTPPTLDHAELTLEYDRNIIATPWNSTVKMPIVFYGDEYRINVPQFYNPGKGEFHININGFDALDVDLESVGSPDIFDYWVVTSVVDPYRNSKVANNFYKSINSYIVIPDSVVKSLTSVNTPYITIYCYTYYDFTRYESKPITIGFEPRIENASIDTFKMGQLKHESGNPIKYISGVPTLKAGSSLMYGCSITDIEYFKNVYIGEMSVNNFQKDLLYPNNTYSSAHPTHIVNQEITIPDNIAFEKLLINVKANEVELIDNVTVTKQYNIRVDTISDESNRCKSPLSFEETYESQPWTEEDAKENLNLSNELQMLEGLYQWPRGNYTSNGDFDSIKITDDVSLPSLVRGPNYDEITGGIRYVTFSYDMPICNGFWISFENAHNIEVNKDTQAYKNIAQFRCEVEGQTGWLNMSIPYEGVLSPRETNEGCLVVASSNTEEKYITFGNEPLSGKLNITVGINEYSAVKFSGIKIVFNT